MDRNLASCGLWGHKELDMTEWTSPAHTAWIDYGFKNINEMMLVWVVNWRSTKKQQLMTAERKQMIWHLLGEMYDVLTWGYSLYRHQ